MDKTEWKQLVSLIFFGILCDVFINESDNYNGGCNHTEPMNHDHMELANHDISQLQPHGGMWVRIPVLSKKFMSTVNPVLLAATTNTVVCSRNEDENAKVGVRL